MSRTQAIFSPSASIKEDPLAFVTMPPPDEHPHARDLRLQREAEARRVSDAIDEAIRAEQRSQKRRKPVKLLLLGQSESGKSTTLRQFQRIYTPTAFREERVLWRAVIQLNLVRSIRTILDALSDAQERSDAVLSGNEDGDTDTDEPQFSSELESLRMRLLPLRHIESLLIAKLVPPNEDEATQLHRPGSGKGKGVANGSGSGSGSGNVAERVRYSSEVFVRPGTAWKGVVARASSSLKSSRPTSAGSTGLETQDEPTAVLHSCCADMKALWSDKMVRDLLRRRKVRLEESPGFFLNELDRVTGLHYLPSDDDVLRARLKTVGVSEYQLDMEAAAGRESGTQWRIVDVGGARSQRPTWVPFFDDVNAIIFLAPISAFDQVLAEDRSVNRLEDSVLLWKSVCSNKLLQHVDLVLFLNKCDILDRKLKAGIRLSKYLRSFGERTNDVETVTKYLSSKFGAIQREYSPIPRKFYCFSTSVTDISTTAGIIASVRDIVIREYLRQSKLL